MRATLNRFSAGALEQASGALDRVVKFGRRCVATTRRRTGGVLLAVPLAGPACNFDGNGLTNPPNTDTNGSTSSAGPTSTGETQGGSSGTTQLTTGPDPSTTTQAVTEGVTDTGSSDASEASTMPEGTTEGTNGTTTDATTDGTSGTTTTGGEPCGNGVIDEDEECDPACVAQGEGFTAECDPATCTWVKQGRCGDGVVDFPLEQCDDGNTTNNDGCDSTCTPSAGVFPTCGNGTIDDVSEQEINGGCDEGQNNNPNGPCLPNCTLLDPNDPMATACEV